MLFFFVLQRGNGCLGGGYFFVGSSEDFRCRFDIFLRRADLAVALIELLLRGFLCRLGEGYFSAGFFDFHLPCGDRAWEGFCLCESVVVLRLGGFERRVHRFRGCGCFFGCGFQSSCGSVLFGFFVGLFLNVAE